MSLQNCPITKVVTLLSDTWTMLILRSLNEGPKRFCELENWLDGISTRTLTLKLKKLVDADLITKNIEGKYQVTQKGSGTKIIERAMVKYNKLYLEK